MLAFVDSDAVAGNVIPAPEADGVAAPTPIVVLAFTVVATTVVGVVAPTVPLMLMDAVPVKFVTTPLAGVPRAGVTNVGEVNDLFVIPLTVLESVKTLLGVITAERFTVAMIRPLVEPLGKLQLLQVSMLRCRLQSV